MSSIVITGNDLTLEQLALICRENAKIELAEEAKQNMYNDIVEYMIFAIDSYEDEVHEMDTDDPFYGLYEEMENLENE